MWLCAPELTLETIFEKSLFLMILVVVESERSHIANRIDGLFDFEVIVVTNRWGGDQDHDGEDFRISPGQKIWLIDYYYGRMIQVFFVQDITPVGGSDYKLYDYVSTVKHFGEVPA